MNYTNTTLAIIGPFEKFGFEQQAQILQDAYLVLLEKNITGEDIKKLRDPNLARKEVLTEVDKDKYRERVKQFKEWARRLKLLLSSIYLISGVFKTLLCCDVGTNSSHKPEVKRLLQKP